MTTPLLPDRRSRASREIGRARQDPSSYIIAFLLAAALLIFVLWPMASMFLEPSGADWQQYLTSDRLRGVTWNTAVMVILSTVTATAIGFVFAYGLTRDDIPGKRFFRLISLLPLISPPFALGLALILLFGRSGLITSDLLGMNVDARGLLGLWVVQTFTFYPVAVLAMVSVLRNQNPAMEWAARDLGQSWFGIMRTITVPLALPGILGAALLVAMLVLADFGNPLIIAGDFRVLAVEAYIQVIGRFNMGLAAVLAIMLLVPALLLFLLQRRFLGRRSYITVTGKESTLRPIPTPRGVRYALVTFMSLVAAFVIITYASIFAGAVTRVWGVDWTLTFEHLEFVVFRTGDLRNSAAFAAIAAICCAVIATTAAYFLHRRPVPGRGALDILAVLPAALPGTMVGIAYVVTFNQAPLVLTGTGAIIVISMVIRALPVGYRSSVAALHQIGPSIDESAADLGAGAARTYRTVMLPLMKGAFTAAFIYAFVESINTVSAVIFLVSPGNQLASVTIMGLAEHGYWGEATAMSAALMLVTFAALGIFRLVTRGRVRLFEL
jgi:iron(III) transport system permease protein